MKLSEQTVEYKITHVLKGYKPLCFVDGNLLVFRKGKLCLLDLDSMKKSHLMKLHRPFWHSILGQFRLATRLLRLEPRAAVCENGSAYFGYKGFIYELEIESNKLDVVHQFREKMQAPLVIAKISDIPGFDDMICYGEYFGNPNKHPVSIIGKKASSKKWTELFRFEEGEINHIHSIVPDSYNNRVWVLTGDDDQAVAIWYSTDNFRTLNKFIGGKQDYRCCSVFPHQGGFTYATDTPLRDNFIFSINLEDKSVTTITDINGSCIYSCVVGGDILISTTVEGSTQKNKLLNLLYRQRGPGIKSWDSELLIGNASTGFKKIAAFEKDYLPTGLFQFGTLVFPHGENDTGKIIFYGNSVKDVDGRLVVLNFSGIS